MKHCKCSPEGVLRPQAGVPLQLRWLATIGTQEPLLKMAGKEALKGRQNVLASPAEVERYPCLCSFQAFGL